jgi:protein phosphatase
MGMGGRSKSLLRGRSSSSSSTASSATSTASSASTVAASSTMPDVETTGAGLQMHGDAGEVEVGSPVVVAGEYGLVRYLGPIHSAPEAGVHAGIELENPKGDCNGGKDGAQYFQCDPHYGIIVPISHVQLAELRQDSDGEESGDENDGEGGGAKAVAQVSQKLLARRKFMKERNSKVWNKLDNLNEQMAIKCSIQMQSLYGASDGEGGAGTMEQGSEPEVPADYAGPRLKLPLTAQNVQDLLEAFKQGQILHANYVAQLLWASRDIFNRESTVQSFTIGQAGGEGARLTVIGDIHGQLQDLYSIFTINGLPSEANAYLFNGDFVDRGPCGVEVFLSICALKLLYPSTVLLNRGNHESRQQNRLMGFEEEVLTKYSGLDGKRLLSLFHSCFDALPLCAVVQEKIFVVHGGLFSQDGVTLDHLRGISRRREPPIHGQAFEDQLFEAMLWSDPRSIHGRQTSSRGAGVEFGQDVTHEFLRANHAALIIRSHECVQEGFQLVHGGRLITLFSASRYCGLQTNKGAFLTIGEDLQPEIQQFYAHSMDNTKWEAPSDLDQRLEEDTVAKIVECILDAKPSLYWHFSRTDSEKTGCVTRAKWAEGLRLVLQMDLPFLSYLEHLAEVEPDGTINYSKFLERHRVEMAGEQGEAWEDGIIDAIYEKMSAALGAQHRGLRQAFDEFDKDRSGTIDYEEFIKTLKSLDVGLSDVQIYELMRGLDTDCDAVIDFGEFSSRFSCVFEQREGSGGAGPESEAAATEELQLQQQQQSPTRARRESRRKSQLAAATGVIPDAAAAAAAADNWQDGVIQSISHFIFQHRQQLGSAFRIFDRNNDGVISLAEFREGMNSLNATFNAPLTSDQIDVMMKVLDTDADGQLSYSEFLSGFQVKDTKKVDEALRRTSLASVEKVVASVGLQIPQSASVEAAAGS